MVKFEVWNNKKFECERRNNLKFKDAVETLKVIGSNNIICIQNYCPFTRNDIKVRCEDFSYNFTFTNNQMKKINKLLVELNHGEEPEWRWY